MEAKKKIDETRGPAPPKPGAADEKKEKPWPTLENEVMDKWAKNIEKNRNKPGSIPYPFDRE